MSSTLKHVLATLAVLVLCTVSVHGRCRMPTSHRTDLAFEEKFRQSDVVVSGKVVGTRFDASRSMFGQRVYTAELMIYCVYKGQPPAIRVNVSEVGEMPGNCPPIHLRLGHEYLVMLGVDNGRYLVRYRPEFYNYVSINQIITFCGIDVNPPVVAPGQRKGNTRMTCSAVKENPSCATTAPAPTTELPTTVAPTTTTTTTTRAPTEAPTTRAPPKVAPTRAPVPRATTEAAAEPQVTVSYSEVTESGVKVVTKEKETMPKPVENNPMDEPKDEGKKVKKDAAQTPELNRQVQDTESGNKKAGKENISPVRSKEVENSASTLLPVTSLLILLTSLYIL